MKSAIDTDVLVVGGGLAGTWAALRAKDFVDSVVLVDKARVSRSGMSTFAAGVMLCPMPGDNLREWTEEMVQSGEYLADQEWVELMLHEQVERIREMERWGVPFERDCDGKIMRILGRGHLRTRLLMFHGKKLMEEMRKQVLRKEIKLIERTMITGLITSDGRYPTQDRVVGAVGFNPRTGEFLTIRAKAIVLAAGPANGKFGGGYCDNITGDGTAMAFNTGTELCGMEFAIRGDPVVWDRKYITYGINMIQAFGAKFINAKGERYMEKYSPVLKERARKSEICLAMCKEVLEGRGPLYCDMREVPPEAFERFRRVIPHTMRIFDTVGVDPSKQLIEHGTIWAIHIGSGEGGIRTNIKCETGIPGLYSAGGNNWNPTHGTYSVGGTNLAFCNVSGYIAGESAAQHARQSGEVEISADHLETLREVTLAPLGRRKGYRPDEIFERIYRAVSPAQFGAFKTGVRLEASLAMLEEARQFATQLMAANYHELVKACEAVNYLLLAELALRASLERKESRGFHFREDYPEQDDVNWLRWVILKRENEKVRVRLDPVHIDRYPVKPPTFEKHPRAVTYFFKK